MNPELLRKFFKGDCNSEEVYAILRWINSPEGKIELGEFFADHGDDYPLDPQKSREIFERISQRVSAEEELATDEDSRPVGSPNATKPKIGRFVVRIAAACIVFLALGWVLIHTYSSQKQDMLPMAEDSQWIERSVPIGQKLKLKLEDGSQVTLNSLSSIRFPKKFAADSREVVLEGEAFFDVKPDANRPFLVRAEQVDTKVLGTSFLVRSGAKSQAAIVAVLTGKVQVSLPDSSLSHGETVMLEAMDGVSVAEDALSFRKLRVGYDEVFAWKDDVISFRDATFGEVADRLEKWYGVIIFPPLQWEPKKNYSGRFESQTLEEVLFGLSFVYDFKFQIRNDTVNIYR